MLHQNDLEECMLTLESCKSVLFQTTETFSLSAGFLVFCRLQVTREMHTIDCTGSGI